MDIIEEATKKNKQGYCAAPRIPSCGNCVHLVINNVDVLELLMLFGDDTPILEREAFSKAIIKCKLGDFPVEKQACCLDHKNYTENYLRKVKQPRDKP